MSRRFTTSIRPSLWFVAGLLGATWLAFQPGALEFDDRAVFGFASRLVQSGFRWRDFTVPSGSDASYSYLNHDFAWFILQVVWYLPYSLVSRLLNPLNSSFAAQAYIAAWTNLSIWVCLFVAWKVLRQRHLSPAFSGLTVAAIFAGGYYVSILPTSLLADIEALLICFQFLFLGWRGEGVTRGAFLAGFCGGYMVALRLYAVPAVAVLIFLAVHNEQEHRKRLICAWGAGVMLAIAIGILPKLLLSLPYVAYSTWMGPPLSSPLFLPTYVARFFQALFSFGYGFLWTAPFYLFAFFARDRRALIWKLIALLSILAVTLLFPFWAGESGVAGNRYMLAYTLLLLPEAGEGFRHMASRHRGVIFAVPALIIGFIPCFEFRHNVTTQYAVGMSPPGDHPFPIIGQVVAGNPRAIDPHMPTWNPLFHPAVFGWWQAYALWSGNRMILPLGASVSVDPILVPVYGLAPRIAYLDALSPDEIRDERLVAARQFLFRIPVWVRLSVVMLAMLALVGWLWLLVWSLRSGWQELHPEAGSTA